MVTPATHGDWRTRPVAGIGIVGLDHVAVTDSWERDGKSSSSRYFEQVGGPVPVALMTMARLGLEEPPRFYWTVGRDEAGAKVRRLLEENSVDASPIRYGGGDTGHSLVVLNTSDGTRAVTNTTGPATEDNTTRPLGLYPNPKMLEAGLLHVDGRNSLTCGTVMRPVQESGGLISYDLGTWRETSFGICKGSDIVIASKAGGAGAFPDCANDPIEQTKRFLDNGATVAGVTLGANGVVIGSRDENGGVPVHLPAFTVANVVDTCGAGDCFHGAFLWAYRSGRTVIESAMFAQAAVALRIQCYGNVAGLPTQAAVEAFLVR